MHGYGDCQATCLCATVHPVDQRRARLIPDRDTLRACCFLAPGLLRKLFGFQLLQGRPLTSVQSMEEILREGQATVKPLTHLLLEGCRALTLPCRPIGVRAISLRIEEGFIPLSQSLAL